MAPRVLEGLESLNPSQEEKTSLRARLAALANPDLRDPDFDIGCPVDFTFPPFSWMVWWRFRVHYRYDDEEVDIIFVGLS
jgi:hypothetical protein